MSDLSGKVVFISGAAKGIGAMTARAMAKAGATVVIGDIDTDGAQAVADEIGGSALKLDVTAEADWTAAMAEVKDRHGRLHGLVNNAGIMISKPFILTTLEDLHKTNAVNVDGVFLGMKAAAPLMHESGGGSIVNLSSIFGQVAGPMHSAYCASKGAVRLLTKSVGTELFRMGWAVRVNSVHPGPVDTELGMGAIDVAVDLGLVKDRETGKAMVDAQHPMGRMAVPSDICGAILFLLSEASGFMTGTELTVDGGYTAV